MQWHHGRIYYSLFHLPWLTATFAYFVKLCMIDNPVRWKKGPKLKPKRSVLLSLICTKSSSTIQCWMSCEMSSGRANTKRMCFCARFTYFRADSNIAFGFGFGTPSLRHGGLQAWSPISWIKYEPRINVIANEVVTILYSLYFTRHPFFSASLMAIRNQIVLM